MRAKFIVELDEAEGFEEDEFEYQLAEELPYVVVNEECATAGWGIDDIVCRCQSKVEAERIARLLSEHGLS